MKVVIAILLWVFILFPTAVAIFAIPILGWICAPFLVVLGLYVTAKWVEG
jgi:hypothetical protein